MRSLLVSWALAAPAWASDVPVLEAEAPALRWEDILASGDEVRLRDLTQDPSAPPGIRLQAALILLQRDSAPEPATPQVVEVPSNNPEYACDKDGQVVRRVPVVGQATLVDLTVELKGESVLVRGRLDGAAGRPLHYLVEGGSETYPSRYVVSMLGVRSGLGELAVPANRLVRSVQIIERDGAVIIVVNSVEERALRVDFEQEEDGFLIAMRVARST